MKKTETLASSFMIVVFVATFIFVVWQSCEPGTALEASEKPTKPLTEASEKPTKPLTEAECERMEKLVGICED